MWVGLECLKNSGGSTRPNLRGLEKNFGKGGKLFSKSKFGKEVPPLKKKEEKREKKRKPGGLPSTPGYIIGEKA